jgi:hypothetical protein
MGAFFLLSSLICLVTAILGFYLSVRLDLPLGPTDVAFGCALIFVIHGVPLMARKRRAAAVLLGVLLLVSSGCSTQSPQPKLDARMLGGETLWLAPVRNSSGLDLRLPGANPLRSLGELAGKISPDYRPTVMDLLRGSMQRELERRSVSLSLPEERDARLQSLPFDAGSAANHARAAGFSGWLLLTEIRRWHTDGRSPLRSWIEMRLVEIDSGVVNWQRQVQKTTPFAGAARLDEVSADAVKEILRDVFAP